MSRCPNCNHDSVLGEPETYTTSNGILHSTFQCVDRLKSDRDRWKAMAERMAKALEFQHTPLSKKLLSDFEAMK